ncbi:lactoylglutathione lyase [Gonapodya prolifera JEL478]|uniref:Lactoylglutathione lyase n=1 Tax=Gonapodya prolifera (strain JEL478) TaxID=1344416 RepID=A0A138ZYP4_GONPJ|nr:lactoylglutathione lyase [Gonapodya prolifera JEL478]|eukprot:KXS09243.1 lactoylglutathione lyase [Gonapodya prolifera JEL478]
MPLDHLSLPVSSVSASRDFYLKALAPLGYSLFREIRTEGADPSSAPTVVGLKVGYSPDFWLQPGTPNGAHVAFSAKSREQVDQFYKAAIEAGAKDNGAPGIRAQYHKGYYGAFVLDPDGYNVECVYHDMKAMFWAWLGY